MLTEQVDQDLKEAMKSKDEITLSVLRMVRTALKNKQIEIKKELQEADVTTVLKTMIKQYMDALGDFQNAGRTDLADRQQKEIDIISHYLPPAMPAEALEKIVREAIKGMTRTDIGRAMGVAMKAVNGRADGNDVRRIVERLLSG